MVGFNGVQHAIYSCLFVLDARGTRPSLHGSGIEGITNKASAFLDQLRDRNVT
jgi:hypothetical protein